jgi:hypothetical protein
MTEVSRRPLAASPARRHDIQGSAASIPLAPGFGCSNQPGPAKASQELYMDSKRDAESGKTKIPDPASGSTGRDPEDRDVNQEREHEVKDKMMDKTLADSYPASDPPSSIPDPSEEDSLEVDKDQDKKKDEAA